MAFNPNYGLMSQGSANLANATANLGQQLGGGLQALGQGYALGEQREQAAAQQSQLQELVRAAMSGNQEALSQVNGINPELGMKIQEQLTTQQGAASDEMKKNTIEAVQRLYKASPEDQPALLEQMIADPSLDIDEADIPYINDENIIRAGLTDYYGKDYADAFLGGESTPMTEYQAEMVKGSKADREIRKLEAQNKAIENKLKAETNAVKLDELKNRVAANKAKQANIVKEKEDAALGIVEAGNATLDLVNEISNHPGFSSAIGAKGLSSGFGLFDEPVAGSDASGVAALIETLEAQNFLTAIAQFKSAGGAGALSDNEGKKLGAALSNLKRAQSEKDFRKSLGIIKSLVGKQISKASKQAPIAGDEPIQTKEAPSKIDYSGFSLDELKAMRDGM